MGSIKEPKKLARIALLFWLASLALPGITFYTSKILYGFQILFFGWISIAAFNFAWLANIFFLYGANKIATGRESTKAPIIAVILSLDALRLSRGMAADSFNVIPVYGYGWGFFVWIAAILLLLIASQTTDESRKNIKAPFMASAAFSLLVIALLAFISIRDHLNASSIELERLSASAFKRGKVCTEEPFVTEKTIKQFGGILEIQRDSTSLYSSTSPFSYPELLLSWGIPYIRMNGLDFSFSSEITDRQTISTPSKGTSDAILFFHQDRSGIKIKLLDNKSDQIVLEKIWRREDLGINDYYYCPTYSSYPKINQAPRDILLKALGMPSQEEIHRDEKTIWDREIIDGEIIDSPEKHDDFEDIKSDLKKNKPYMNDRDIHYALINKNCPENTGLTTSEELPASQSRTAFIFKGKTFYFKNHFRFRTICTSDAIYIYNPIFKQGNNLTRIAIEKRSLHDFRSIWAVLISTPDTGHFKERINPIRIRNILENEGTLIIDATDDNSKKAFVIKTAIP